MKYAFFFYFLILLSFSSCHKKNPQMPTPPPVDVVAFNVEAKTIPATFEFLGFAESSHPVEIRARVEGYLTDIAYTEGQLVHEGDLLFKLDPKQYEVKVEQSKGDVTKQEAVLENANLTVNRLKPLYQQKAASKKDLDNAIAAQLSAEASLQTAKAQLNENELNLSYTTIHSPITGLADRSRYREGALITPGTNSLLTTVSVVDPIWVTFTVSDNDLLHARQQKQEHRIILPQQNEFDVEVILNDGSVLPNRGKVNFSAPTYDQSTGTLQVRAVLDNPKEDLRPGQFVRLKLYGAQRPDAIFVPQRALLQKKNGMFVYLINKENKAVAQDVSTGDWFGDYIIITNGLKSGDLVITDGINKVRPGMTVNVTKTLQPEVTSMLTPVQD